MKKAHTLSKKKEKDKESFYQRSSTCVIELGYSSSDKAAVLGASVPLALHAGN